MKRVVVTGSSGFVGLNLRKYLFTNFSIDIIPFARESWNDISLCNFEKNTAIIHLAGKAHDLKKVSKPDEYYYVNTELTKKLYDRFLDSDSETFIFLSSVKAVADSSDSILNEDVIPNPISDYGKSKALAEQYILQNIPLNKKVFILRPTMIHGTGNKGNLNLLYKIVKKKIPWPLGAFDNKRSFCSVDNLCFILGELIQRSDIQSGIYNVCDDIPLSTNQIIRLISTSQNRKPILLNIPKKVVYKIAFLGDKISLPLNSERLHKLTENFIVSNSKILSAINKKLPFTSEQGLIKTFKSFD